MMKNYVKGWPIACVLLLLLMTSFNATMVPKVNGEMYYYDSYYTSNENLVSKVGIAKNNASNNSSVTSTVSTNSTGPSINNNGNSKCSISALQQVKGIGRWTAEMFLIFCLRRQDVLPVTDLGIRKAMQKLYSLPELPKPATMLAISQPWKPYRSIATWY